MRRTSRALSRSTKAGCAAAVLVLLAGCGDSEGEAAADPSTSAPARTQTAAELEAAIVTGADVPGHTSGGRAADEHYEESEATASQPECTVQARIAVGMAVGDTVAVAQRTSVAGPDGPRTGSGPVRTLVTLASYKNKDEGDVQFDLGKAGTVCNAFDFTVTLRGKDIRVTPGPTTTDPRRTDLGDDITWFTLSGGEGEDAETYKVLVVRKGHTLAYFSSHYPGELEAAAPGKLPFPEDVARAQMKKLADVR